MKAIACVWNAARHSMGHVTCTSFLGILSLKSTQYNILVFWGCMFTLEIYEGMRWTRYEANIIVDISAIIVQPAVSQRTCQSACVAALDTLASSITTLDFPRYWPFVRGIHRWPVNCNHKGQWRRALIFRFNPRLNKQLKKQPRCWWFEMPSCSL